MRSPKVDTSVASPPSQHVDGRPHFLPRIHMTLVHSH